MKEGFNKLPDVRTIASRLMASKNGVLGVIIGSSAAMIAAVVLSAPEPDKKQVEETAWAVTTMTATPQRVSPELRLYGRIETPRQSTLTAMLVAQVQSVDVLEGSTVEEGDVLVQLDPTDAILEVDRREADLTEARTSLDTLELKVAENEEVLAHERRLYELSVARLERHKKLRRDSSISEELLNTVESESNRQAISLSRQQGLVDDAANRLARAEAQVRRAEALLREAKVRLERTGIRAPFDGRVTSVTVSPGEVVQPGAPVIEMYDTATMEVRAQIPADSLPVIRETLASGTALSARIEANHHHVDAQLTRLSGEVGKGRSSTDGLFTVHGNTALELGRAVSVTVMLPPVENTVQVPVQALYGHDRIYVVENDRLKAIAVERIGERRDDDGHLNVLVRAAELESDASIVTSRLSNAITGLKVVEAKKPSSDVDGTLDLASNQPSQLEARGS